MEKKRQGAAKRALSEAAELFDLPADAAAGAVHVELVGSSRFFMENHRGILSYSDTEISVGGDGCVVRVLGEGLELQSMTASALRIRGDIRRLEWVR